MVRADEDHENSEPLAWRPHKVELEIRRGKAHQRFRAVNVPVFLLGSAPDCDLVLGDPHFPEVHTYLYLTGHEVTLRHLGFAPFLEVEGEIVENARLQNGQCFRLGPHYEFRIHIRSEGGGTSPRTYRLDPAEHQPPAPNVDMAVEHIRALLNEIRLELNATHSMRFAKPAAQSIRQLLVIQSASQLRASA